MRLVVLLATLLALPAAASAVTAPPIGITSFDQLAKPLPLPYDEKGGADAAVAAARSRATAHGKLLLIDLGGNWCLDCRILAGTIAVPALKAFVDRHYEVVTVDIGRMDKNLQVPAHYGVTSRLVFDAILVDHDLIPRALEAPQLIPALREWMTEIHGI